MNNITLIIIFAAMIGYFIYIKRKFPNGMPAKWDMSNPQARQMAEKLLHLKPGESIVHQSVGHVDPNSHMEESTVRNIGLALGGEKLKDPNVMHLILTSQNRFILAPFDPRIEPLIFDQTSVPKIRDTGKVGRFAKISWIDTQEGRILELESDLIPYLYFRHENAENMELTVPNDFIPHIMSWARKAQEKDQF